MFLYELAIELGVHSSELVDAAGTLGLGQLTSASMLSASEVAALRQHLAIAGPPRRPVPGSTAPPLPAVPTGPLVAEPPGAASTGPVPQAPANWGPPVPPRAAPAPPPPAPVRPATGVPAPAVFAPPTDAVPTFEPPTGLPGGPGQAPPPGVGAPLAATPPTSWDGHWGPPAGAPPGAMPPGPMPPGAMPLGSIPPPPAGEEGWSTGQKVAIGIVALLVVGLFGFMLANTGPDAERERELALADERIEREREQAALTTTTAAPTTVPATTTTTGRGANEVADLEAFCAGGLGIAPLEVRLMAAVIDGDLQEMVQVVRDRRADWTAAVDQLRASGPTSLHDELDTYRSVYDRFLDAIAASPTIDALYQGFSEAELDRGSAAGQAVAAQVTFHCR
jgi:hypothetical protein